MSGTSEIDMAAYLRRIEYFGSVEPTLETLKALHLHHPTAITFENLNPLLRHPVLLDLPALQRKLVTSRRGGYCFEQNILFMNVLRSLGYRVSGLAARVLWGQPEDTVTARGHMLLRVELAEGTYLADVGFGGLTLTAPLRLRAGVEQSTPHETYRLDADGDTWWMRAKVANEWRALYKFQMEEQFQVDYEVTNYFLSTHPSSHFIHSLIAARPTAEGRYTLLAPRLNFHGKDGTSTARELNSAGELEAVLRDIFGLEISDSTALAEALEREGIV